MSPRWRLIRHHRAAIGDMAEYAWVRTNLEMAKADAASDAKEIHGEAVGDPEWVERESAPKTLGWEIDSDHWYTLTELAEELGGVSPADAEGPEAYPDGRQTRHRQSV